MATAATTAPASPAAPTAKKGGGGWNILYLLLALLIGYMVLGQLGLSGGITKPKPKKVTVDAAFNVHHDILASGVDSVAMYNLPEGSTGSFDMYGANAQFSGMGHMMIKSKGIKAGFCNGKWDNPNTSNDILKYAGVLEIEALSDCKISFNAKH